MKVVWIDLVCISSLCELIKISNKVDEIYYLNSHKAIAPFMKYISSAIGKPIIQVTELVESTTSINGKSLYELIQTRLHKITSNFVNSQNIDKKIKTFSIEGHINPRKFSEHIREASYYFLYTPVELKIFSEKFGETGGDYFIIQKSPFSKVNKDFLGIHAKFYTFFSFSTYFITSRKEYFHDTYLNLYLNGRSEQLFKFYISWILIGFFSIFYKVKNREKSYPNIGVELVQSKINLNGVNDLFWMKESGISPNNIIGLSYVDYDTRSLKNLKSTGIKLVIAINLLMRKPLLFFKNNNYNTTFIERKSFLRISNGITRNLFLLFGKGSSNWIDIQANIYLLKSKYWSQVYKDNGICVLWSMLDVDPEKNIKSQAIESLGGKFIGSHWSNYPDNRVNTQKCYDIFFAWSEYFANYNVVSDNLYVLGYPSDHYFDNIRLLAQKSKKMYGNKFVISFHDNIVFNDIMYSVQMQIDIHLLLISLLNKFPNIVILLKPKRIHTFKEVYKRVPELKKWINNGRIEVFLGDSNMSKVPPVQVGMMSDLVIGLGISTAAAECCFGGTVSFHADFTGFYDNEFANKCDGKFVYRNIVDLRSAIENQINGTGFSVKDCQEYHKILDPFQDGMTYKRTGKIIKDLLESLRK